MTPVTASKGGTKVKQILVESQDGAGEKHTIIIWPKWATIITVLSGLLGLVMLAVPAVRATVVVPAAQEEVAKAMRMHVEWANSEHGKIWEAIEANRLERKEQLDKMQAEFDKHMTSFDEGLKRIEDLMLEHKKAAR